MVRKFNKIWVFKNKVKDFLVLGKKLSGTKSIIITLGFGKTEKQARLNAHKRFPKEVFSDGSF